MINRITFNYSTVQQKETFLAHIKKLYRVTKTKQTAKDKRNTIYIFVEEK